MKRRPFPAVSEAGGAAGPVPAVPFSCYRSRGGRKAQPEDGGHGSRRSWNWWPIALILGILSGGNVLAHPLAPALLKLEQTAPGAFTVTWRPPSGRPGAAALRPHLPKACVQQGETGRRRAGGDFEQSWQIECGGGDPEKPAGALVGGELSVSGLAEARTEVLVSVQWLDGRRASTVLRPQAPSWKIPAKPSNLQVFKDYLHYGVVHILVGLDHLCFVLALMLLVPAPRRLFWTLTGFTLGHSVTLALATLGLFRLPSTLTEAAIAASILIAAVELTRDGPTLLRRWSVPAAAAFGLLHGLGFAGVLAEVGLPAGDVPLALLSFNLGIEAGQILFVLVAWLLYRSFRILSRPVLPHLPRWASLLPAYAIGTLAAYWLIERVLGGLLP